MTKKLRPSKFLCLTRTPISVLNKVIFEISFFLFTLQRKKFLIFFNIQRKTFWTPRRHLKENIAYFRKLIFQLSRAGKFWLFLSTTFSWRWQDASQWWTAIRSYRNLNAKLDLRNILIKIFRRLHLRFFSTELTT